jgi:FkbM family methyltransferase
MILDLENLQFKYNLDIKGVIHIGAHHGEEDQCYKKLGIQNKVFVEPISSNFFTMFDKLAEDDDKNVIYFNTALGNYIGHAEMWTSSNQNESASVLKPKNHLQLHNVQFGKKIKVPMTKLDNISLDRSLYNMINIDVQGYELEVFKGGAKTLEGIDYIMSEINRDEVYEDCAHIEELKEFLLPYGFELVESVWAGGQWGDGFFIKTNE